MVQDSYEDKGVGPSTFGKPVSGFDMRAVKEQAFPRRMQGLNKDRSACLNFSVNPEAVSKKS